jgi:hypothetical protein
VREGVSVFGPFHDSAGSCPMTIDLHRFHSPSGCDPKLFPVGVETVERWTLEEPEPFLAGRLRVVVARSLGQ